MTSSPVASSLWNLLVEAAQQHADRPAILAPGRQSLTYRDLAAHITRTARHLRQSGVGTQSRVAVVLPNGPELATAFAGIASCGVCAPLNPAFTRTDSVFLLLSHTTRATLVWQSHRRAGPHPAGRAS